VSQSAEKNIGPYLRALRRAKLLVLDVDGVLTDGRLHYGARGEQTKVFHVRDGHGIKQVARAGITVAIISGRKSAAVARRAKDLGIKFVFQGVDDKMSVFRNLAKQRQVAIDECVCIGDDTPDAPLLAACGVGVAVADAHADALAAADLVTSRHGGQGAVRELCDWLMAARA
jgi:3-deoxy-D-manno-octulosonate 8-phosphate phosphatase (KDO 8-P phosphatase)